MDDRRFVPVFRLVAVGHHLIDGAGACHPSATANSEIVNAVTKIAIIGTAPYHKFLAPFDDEAWEIWPCSPGNARQYKRVTRWFELHGVDDCKGPENNDWNKAYFDWLNEQSFPVYMQEPNDLVPQAKVFPLKAWLQEFGNLGRMAASSSISLMVGYAIMQRPEVIAIFGVEDRKSVV